VSEPGWRGPPSYQLRTRSVNLDWMGTGGLIAQNPLFDPPEYVNSKTKWPLFHECHGATPVSQRGARGRFRAGRGPVSHDFGVLDPPGARWVWYGACRVWALFALF
jgi:hypothetical protein